MLGWVCLLFWGNELWEFETQASVFCSQTLYQDIWYGSRIYWHCIVFGSHDKCVYCLSLNGELSWRFTTERPVYSSPFVAVMEGNMSCHTMCNTRPCDKRDTQLQCLLCQVLEPCIFWIFIQEFSNFLFIAWRSIFFTSCVWQSNSHWL